MIALALQDVKEAPLCAEGILKCLLVDDLGLFNIISIIHHKKKKEPILCFPKGLDVFLQAPFLFRVWNLGLGEGGIFRQDWTHEPFHGFQ